jgi:hypothetical protein
VWRQRQSIRLLAHTQHLALEHANKTAELLFFLEQDFSLVSLSVSALVVLNLHNRSTRSHVTADAVPAALDAPVNDETVNMTSVEEMNKINQYKLRTCVIDKELHLSSYYYTTLVVLTVCPPHLKVQPPLTC